MAGNANVATRLWNTSSTGRSGTRIDRGSSTGHLLLSLSPGRCRLGVVRKPDLHSLCGGPDLRIVLASLGHNGIDALIGVVGIVVEEDEFLCAAFHHHIHGFTPVAMSP